MHHVPSQCDQDRALTLQGAVAVFGMLLLALTCQSSYADDPNEVSLRLQKIRGQVTATEKTLTSLKKEFSDLSKERKSLEEAIKTLSADEEKLIQKGAELTREKSALEIRVVEAERRVTERQSVIRDRLRVLYVNMVASSSASFMLTTKSSEIERGAAYARAVRAHDERRFREVRGAVEALVTARAALEKTFQDSQNLQEEIKQKRSKSEGQVSKLRSVLEQIKEKRDSAQQSLGSLRSEASNLETLLQSITGGDSPVKDGAVIDAPRIQTPMPQEPSAQETSRVASVQRGFGDVASPEGLFGKKVRLTQPVKGNIVQRFGKTKVTDFADMIFSKGLEFETAEGSEVHAVLGGKVAFAGSMPGYDTVVIIDHGSRSYSLYGRLGKAFVTKGDLVKQSDVIGVTSQPDSKKRNFYFETRRNGAPVDPVSVLARAAS